MTNEDPELLLLFSNFIRTIYTQFFESPLVLMCLPIVLLRPLWEDHRAIRIGARCQSSLRKISWKVFRYLTRMVALKAYHPIGKVRKRPLRHKQNTITNLKKTLACRSVFVMLYSCLSLFIIISLVCYLLLVVIC